MRAIGAPAATRSPGFCSTASTTPATGEASASPPARAARLALRRGRLRGRRPRGLDLGIAHQPVGAQPLRARERGLRRLRVGARLREIERGLRAALQPHHHRPRRRRAPPTGTSIAATLASTGADSVRSDPGPASTCP